MPLTASAVVTCPEPPLPVDPAELVGVVLAAARARGGLPASLVPSLLQLLAVPAGLQAAAVLASDPRAHSVGRAASRALRGAAEGQRGGPLELLVVRALATGRPELAAGLLEAASADRPTVLVPLLAMTAAPGADGHRWSAPDGAS